MATTNNNIGAPITVDQAKANLSKGINLSNWFNDYSDPSQYGSRFSPADMQRIKAAGFTCVRLPVASTILFNENAPDVLKPGPLNFIDKAVQNAIDAELNVILDPIHNSRDDFEKKLATDAAFAAKVTTYWQSVARYFSKYPTDKLFFEIYNEPHVATSGAVKGLDKSWWWQMQGKFIQAIRQITLHHYLIAGGESWNGRQTLVANAPYKEVNIIYNFHFYDPFLFTHQGASWAGWPPAVEAALVPYPSSPGGVDSLVRATSFQDLKNELTRYGNQRYNLDSLKNWIKPVATWAARYNVVVVCNEFGSYKARAPRQSRLNWIGDIRKAFEANQIPWAMWEYDEGFGWIEYAGNGRRQPKIDTEVLRALGL